MVPERNRYDESSIIDDSAPRPNIPYKEGQKMVTIKHGRLIAFEITGMEVITSSGYPDYFLFGVDEENHIINVFSDECFPYPTGHFHPVLLRELMRLTAQNNTITDTK